MTLRVAFESYLDGSNAEALDVYEQEHGLASASQVVAHRLDIIDLLLDCEELCNRYGVDPLTERIRLALRWFSVP